MKRCLKFTPLILALALPWLIPTNSWASIKQLRIINETGNNIYVHPGSQGPSIRLAPGKWTVLTYPFIFTSPFSRKKIHSTRVSISSGGVWLTKPNGLTYLNKPDLMTCIDYSEPQHRKKSGKRVWAIKNSLSVDTKCKTISYPQIWYRS